MMAKGTVIEWVDLSRCHPAELKDIKAKMSKRWPPGHQKYDFTRKLEGLMKSMTDNRPGKRPHLYNVCKALERFGAEDAKNHKMKHPFWAPPYINTKLPRSGPPNSYLPNGISIAKKAGFKEGDKVQILIQGSWQNGTVVGISKELAPGAVIVMYKGGAGKEEMAVAPEQFKILRRQNSTPKKQKCCPIM